jgi:hypothetical protein
MTDDQYKLPKEVKELIAEPERSLTARLRKLESLIAARTILNQEITTELSNQRLKLEELIFQQRYSPIVDGGERLRKTREERQRIVSEGNREATDFFSSMHRLSLESLDTKSKLNRAKIKRKLIGNS